MSARAMRRQRPPRARGVARVRGGARRRDTSSDFSRGPACDRRTWAAGSVSPEAKALSPMSPGIDGRNGGDGGSGGSGGGPGERGGARGGGGASSAALKKRNSWGSSGSGSASRSGGSGGSGGGGGSGKLPDARPPLAVAV